MDALARQAENAGEANLVATLRKMSGAFGSKLVPERRLDARCERSAGAAVWAAHGLFAGADGGGSGAVEGNGQRLDRAKTGMFEVTHGVFPRNAEIVIHYMTNGQSGTGLSKLSSAG